MQTITNPHLQSKSSLRAAILAGSIAAWLGAAAAHAVTVNTTGTTITYTAAQNILDTTFTGNGTLNFNGSGVIGLDNSGGGHPDTFSMTGGNITVQSGVTLQNGGWSGGIWTGNLASLDLAGGATLDLWDGNTVYVDALTGAGTVTHTSYGGLTNLTVGVNNGSGTFSGTITETSGHQTSLTKNGTGTQTLSGNNTYSGTTTVNGGTLQLNHSGSGANTLASLALASGTTLAVTGTHATNWSSTVTLTGNVTLSNNNTSGDDLNLGSSGGATVTGGGGTIIANGTSGNINLHYLSLTSNVTFQTDQRINLDQAVNSPGVTITKTGSNVLDFWDGITNLSGLVIDAGRVRFESTGFGSWTGPITVNSGGILSPWTTNSATPNVTLSGGTLSIENSGTVTWNGSVNVTAASTVDAGNGNHVFNGAVTGSGALTLTGGNNVTFSGSGTHISMAGSSAYSGVATINAGTLILQDTKTASSNFVTNANLEFNVTSGQQQLSGGTISGTGHFIKTGSGQLWLGANSSPQTIALTGATSLIDVQGGLLRNEYGNSSWGSNLAALNVASGAVFDTWDGNTTVDYLSGSGIINKGWSNNNTLTIGVNNGSGTFSGTIYNNNTSLGYGGGSGGNLSLVKDGTGTQTLSGVNTYAGGTTINGGTLLVNGSTASGSAVTVGGSTASGTPTLGGSGTINGATTISAASGGAAGIHTPGGVGTVGTQTFTSTLNYGSGSIFEWDLQASTTSDPGVVSNASTGTYDKVVANGSAGSVTGGAAVFKIVLGGNAFTDAFWNTNKSWSDIFTGTGAPTNLASVFSTFSGTNVNSDGTVTGQGYFTFNGSSTLTWTAVPEPSSALAGILLGVGLLRRQRKPVGTSGR